LSNKQCCAVSNHKDEAGVVSIRKKEEWIERLVLTHWIRTALWTARTALLGGLILSLFRVSVSQ
ncbi:hypothetical protein EBQ74_00865, partial [bacterium]|nr:hypothetical protein [bacterium]